MKNGRIMILAMESSKFRKLRKVWFYIKTVIKRKMGELNGRNSEDFDPEYYLKKYSDIANSRWVIDPLTHYCQHGKREGRSGFFDLDEIIKVGGKVYNPQHRTILVICHEASRTGAPILGLEIVRALSSTSNIIVWTGRPGPLTQDFGESSIAIIDKFLHQYDVSMALKHLVEEFSINVAILNSTVVAEMCQPIYEKKIPILFLVHEYADYQKEPILNALKFSNRVVFPAQDLQKGAISIFMGKWGSPPPHTTVCHQGHCIPPKREDALIFTRKEIISSIGLNQETFDRLNPLIVLGCGQVGMRKGLEYFIHAAQFCKQKTSRLVIFIWVGSGYLPEKDLGYSALIQSQIERSNLTQNVFLHQETSDLTSFFDLADVFFLSSRLDPFPNVAIDAVKKQVPVVVFEKATGFTDFVEAHPTVGKIVPYLDAELAAEAILKLGYRDKNQDISLEYAEAFKSLDFSKYTNFLFNACNWCIQNQKLIRDESQILEELNIFNRAFFRSAYPDYEWNGLLTEEYIYVANWTRGIHYAKSRIGFNDLIAQENIQSSNNSELTPLGHLVKSHSPINPTHQVIFIDDELPISKYQNLSIHSSLKIALHIHIHYIDGLPDLLKRLRLIVNSIDVLITTDSDKKAEQILVIYKKAFSDLKNQPFPTIHIMPNRGRDVAPFIMLMKKQAKSYDIVGHFHLKSTKELDFSVVKERQNFSFDTLLGNEGGSAQKIFQNFIQNPKLGLVFQEDPCISRWLSNYDLAQNLLNNLNANLSLPTSLEYPTENMFWARSKALTPLFSKDWQWEDFPEEPIPYDGTILHAIERLFPHICECSNYSWATVNVK